eukprot:TRINITY_DN4904_c0_g1_i1.p1 TRINITY_DN4904_c0_g1~~TRINITY_DN4904_c0_g1_i1.p1  ORF type:complete len:617 (+),score=147.01 TRINITY_DN4904_c0_g1_i1:229-2079(+)
MGIIKSGCTSGVIPGTCNFVVHYPGYPPSISRAIETLGGQEGLRKARSSDTNYLELRFRPEDPYCHPTFGELHHSNSLLLRISKQQQTKQDKSFLDTEGISSSNDTHGEVTRFKSCEQLDADQSFQPKGLSSEFVKDAELNASDTQMGEFEELKADIVAKIDGAYTFDGMVDYQYMLAVHAHAARKKRKRIMDPNFERDKRSLMDIEHDDLMMLIPPLFSLKDMPEQLVLKPSQVTKAKQKQEKLIQQPWEMNIVPCFGIDFKIKEIPPKISWEDKIVKGSNDWILQTEVSRLFEERPVWQKRTLQDKLADEGFNFSHDQLKRVLFRTGYYFGSGPFRSLWIRNGYDARKDPESRIYQQIDFRIPRQLRDLVIADLKDNEKVSWKDICSFKVVPQKKFTCLQLYDLKDDYIQEQIRKPTERTTCRQSTGWFSRNVFDVLRLHVRLRFLSLLPGGAAREIVKSETKYLERYKRMLNSDRTKSEAHSDMAGGIGQSDKVSECMSSKVMNNQLPENQDYHDGNGDEREEAEDSDEEEDEEIDDFEYSTFDGQRFGCDSFGDSYVDVDENIPRNYLQQLLGKFPFTTSNETDFPENELGENDQSDGEYAIYEQESDDFSD